MKQIYVFGHKNPDTDSVCSAIALAYLKNMQGIPATPKVIGQVNNGTKYVLKSPHSVNSLISPITLGNF